MQEKKIPIWLILLLLLIVFPSIFKMLLMLLFPVIILSLIILFLNPQIKAKIKSTLKKTKTTTNTPKEKVINYDQLFKNNLFSNFNPMSKFKLSSIFGFIFLLLIIFIIIDGLVSVPAGNVAVIYDRGKGVLAAELPEGLHLKIPFWQNATILDTRLQEYTMSIASGEGDLYGDDAIEALTKDGQKVFVDVTVQYRIEPENASYIYQKIGLDYKAKIIRPEVRAVIREVVTGYESKSLFNIETRQKAAQQMEESLKKRYANKKILLESVLLRNIQFSASYINAIEEKQIAEQKIQKAEYERQEAEKIKERKIIEAQAEAEAIRLKGETLKANPQVIQFEFVQKMAPNIDWGILPDGVIPMLDLKEINK